MNENTLRAKTAYQAYQDGFPATVPHWDLAPSWVRDIAVACYLQGKLDGLSAALAHKPVGDEQKVRDECAALVASMCHQKRWADHLLARGALFLAASAIRRGRHLSDSERATNLMDALAELPPNNITIRAPK